MLSFDPNDPCTLELKRAPERWRAAAEEVCRGAGVPADRFEPFSAGSALVAAVSERAVLKLIQPPFKGEAAAERWALSQLAGAALPVPVPTLLGHGELDGGWTWVLLSRVPGTTLDGVWPGLAREQRARLLTEIGELMAAVHARPVTEPERHVDAWASFVSAQADGCVARHRRLGLPEPLIAEIPAWVERTTEALPKTFTPVLLTGEYTPFNLHVEPANGGWRLCGMLDFGDAFAGLASYDLIGPGGFLAAGDPQLVRALLDGYGLGSMSAALRQELLGLHLLHRFSHLEGQIAIEGWQDELHTLDALARRVWPDV